MALTFDHRSVYHSRPTPSESLGGKSDARLLDSSIRLGTTVLCLQDRPPWELILRDCSEALGLFPLILNSSFLLLFQMSLFSSQKCLIDYQSFSSYHCCATLNVIVRGEPNRILFSKLDYIRLYLSGAGRIIYLWWSQVCIAVLFPRILFPTLCWKYQISPMYSLSQIWFRPDVQAFLFSIVILAT